MDNLEYRALEYCATISILWGVCYSGRKNYRKKASCVIKSCKFLAIINKTFFIERSQADLWMILAVVFLNLLLAFPTELAAILSINLLSSYLFVDTSERACRNLSSTTATQVAKYSDLIFSFVRSTKLVQLKVFARTPGGVVFPFCRISKTITNKTKAGFAQRMSCSRMRRADSGRRHM